MFVSSESTTPYLFNSSFVQIVIATPGRLIEILKQKAVRLDDVRAIVVDEVSIHPSIHLYIF